MLYFAGRVILLLRPPHPFKDAATDRCCILRMTDTLFLFLCSLLGGVAVCKPSGGASAPLRGDPAQACAVSSLVAHQLYLS